MYMYTMAGSQSSQPTKQIQEKPNPPTLPIPSATNKWKQRKGTGKIAQQVKRASCLWLETDPGTHREVVRWRFSTKLSPHWHICQGHSNRTAQKRGQWRWTAAATPADTKQETADSSQWVPGQSRRHNKMLPETNLTVFADRSAKTSGS